MGPVLSTRIARLRAAVLGLFVLLAVGQALAAAPTTTTLSIGPSNNVTAGTVLTLTATVTNPSPVTRGTVLFCNALITHCGPGRGLYGTATLTSAGTAVLRTRLGTGVANVQASFIATSANAGSTSPTNAVAVSPSQIYGSAITLNEAGGPGNYTLSGNVLVFGNQVFSGPSPVVILDQSAGFSQIASASFGSVSRSFASGVQYDTQAMPASVAAGDFNGDGIPDLAVANSGANTVSIELGNANGTFQNQVAYAAGGAPNSVAVGDFNGDGIPDLVVANTINGTGTVSVLLGRGDGTFLPKTTYGAGSDPISVAIGDFNGDGIQDLVVCNADTSFVVGTVSILLGRGDGTFLPQATSNTGAAPYSAAVGDFNGDGIQDLIVANSSDDTLSVLLGRGDGTFLPQEVLTTGSMPWAIVVGDFNGDGKEDYAVVSNGSNAVSVAFGNGDGTFQPETSYSTGWNPLSEVVGDFNGDGIADIATTNGDSETVSVLLGNGDGTFHVGASYSVGDYPSSIAIADFNGDGIPDVVEADHDDDAVSVLLGEQIATYFIGSISVSGGPTAHTLQAAFEPDGSRTSSHSNTVLVTAVNKTTPTVTASCSPSSIPFGSTTSCTAHVSGGTGTVTFSGNSGVWPISVDGSGNAVLSGFSNWPVGDYTILATYSGDGNYNTASGTASLTVTSAGPSSTSTSLNASSNNVVAGAVVTLTATVANPAPVTQGVVLFCNSVAAYCSQGLGLYGSVSLNPSGTAVLKLKLPVGANNVQAVFVATSVNAASTSPSTAVTVAASPIYASSTTLARGGVPGNYNLGGFVTAYGGQMFGSSVALLDTTNGNGQIATSALSLPYFQYTQTTNPIASRSWSSVVGDFNGDGIPDLAVATYTGDALDILLGNGDGTFQAAVPYALTSAASSVVVGDFNGDGKVDLAVANWQTNDISIFIGVGNGTFLPQVKYAVGIEPTSISVGDFNRDGIMDLAVTNQVGNTVSILIGQGDGTFKPQVAYATGTSPYSVTNGDFNEDGKIDLAVANYGGSIISVFLGNGDGTFLAPVSYTVGSAPSAVTTGDFNSDGHLDLAVANSGSNTASILIGHGDGTFSAAVSYPTGTTPMSVSAGDFNNDGALDLITGNSGSDTVSLLLGTGSGTFGVQSTVAGSYSYQGLAVGDFNGDGLLDFAANQNGGTATELVFLGQLRESFNVTGVSILGSGTHNILASFPGDAIRTASQSATVPLTATKLTPVLTWAGPSGIMYGTPLSATQLNATSGGIAGTFAYTPAAGAIIPAGLQTLSVTFTPTDATTYNSATTTVTIIVNKVTPVLTWANPTAITYGTALSATQLNATSGGVAGTFGYTPASGTVLTSGSHTLSVTFMPTDTTDYNNSSAIATLVVNKAPLTVTPTAASRPYGAANPAFSGTITGMATGDGITAVYASGATVTTAAGVYSSGANAIASTLQDPNGKLANYNVTQNLGALTIAQTTATMGMTSSLNPSKYGDSITFTVTATGVAGAANPTGTVTVSDGGTTLATITLDASGTATQSIQTLTAGSHSLSAVYVGDANYK